LGPKLRMAVQWVSFWGR